MSRLPASALEESEQIHAILRPLLSEEGAAARRATALAGPEGRPLAFGELDAIIDALVLRMRVDPRPPRPKTQEVKRVATPVAERAIPPLPPPGPLPPPVPTGMMPRPAVAPTDAVAKSDEARKPETRREARVDTAAAPPPVPPPKPPTGQTTRPSLAPAPVTGRVERPPAPPTGRSERPPAPPTGRSERVVRDTRPDLPPEMVPPLPPAAAPAPPPPAPPKRAVLQVRAADEVTGPLLLAVPGNAPETFHLYDDIVMLSAMNDRDGLMISLERLLVLARLEDHVRVFIDANEAKLVGLYEGQLKAFSRAPKRRPPAVDNSMPRAFLRGEKVAAVLQLVDGSATINEICQRAAPLTRLEALSVLAQLQRSGIIEV